MEDQGAGREEERRDGERKTKTIRIHIGGTN